MLGFPFALPMESDKCFEEVQVGEFSCLGARATNRHRPLKRRTDLSLFCLLHPFEDGRNVSPVIIRSRRTPLRERSDSEERRRR